MNTFDEHRFLGSQRDGKLLIKEIQEFARHLRALGEGPLEIVVQKFRKRRTARQNDFYWAMCLIVGDQFGYSKDEMHDVFKGMFLVDKEIRVVKTTGEIVEFHRAISTADLSTKEFSEYFEKCIRFAADHKIEIPKQKDEENIDTAN